jgi:hypothetical protein
MQMKLKGFTVLALVWLVLALALQLGQCRALRNPFAALWADPLNVDNVQQRRSTSSIADVLGHRRSKADDRCGGRANDAERRHQINGVVMLVDGKYDFTYRPIAGELWYGVVNVVYSTC